VLIVEDDADVRVLAESIIGDSGYRTLSAASGREALALLEQGAAIALLFTDINLGAEPDGIELARRVIEDHPGLRVIYTTGGGQTDGMDALLVEGAIFLPKPYTRDQLLSALKQQISGSQQTDS
jgi:DNA-binding NtrC family response regulator